jgi:hypothetical protein
MRLGVNHATVEEWRFGVKSALTAAALAIAMRESEFPSGADPT